MIAFRRWNTTPSKDTTKFFICCYTGCYASQKIDKVNAHRKDHSIFIRRWQKDHEGKQQQVWDEDDNDPKEKLFKIIVHP